MTQGSPPDDRLKRYFNLFWPAVENVVRKVSANSLVGSLRGQDSVISSIPGIVRNALSNLDDVDRDIRKEAVRMLASMQHPVAREAVVNALKHPMRDVRVAAAEALQRIKDAAAVPALIEALRDEDIGVRGTTAAALVKIRDPAVLALTEALRDEDSSVRTRAAAALKRIDK
jgi:HEAT repeat protein